MAGDRGVEPALHEAGGDGARIGWRLAGRLGSLALDIAAGVEEAGSRCPRRSRGRTGHHAAARRRSEHGRHLRRALIAMPATSRSALRTGHVAIAADVGRKARIGNDVRS